METTKIALSKGKKIRRTIFENEWWFSVLQAPDGKMRDIDRACNEDRRKIL